MKILRVKELMKYYHTLKEEILALDNISFDVYKNEFISIVGPSGCGKSTILSILSGLIDKSYGSIELDNKCRIAYMLQDDCLLPFRTILDNCLIGLEVQNLLTDESKEYVLSLLNKYGLSDFIDKYPSSLSGGMRQRCALIRTLALKPDILVHPVGHKNPEKLDNLYKQLNTKIIEIERNKNKSSTTQIINKIRNIK